jgi:DNA-binding MarR family transcriptional regulator
MDDRLVNLVGAVALGLTDRVDRAVHQASGRSGATAAALAALVGEPGLTVAELSVVLGISASGVVRLLDRLVADGLAERRPGVDARSLAVHLTPAGAELGRSVLDHRRAALAGPLATLDPAEQEALTAAVEKILTALTPTVDVAERVCRLCDLDACPQDRCPADPVVR